jgi:hemolysin III
MPRSVVAFLLFFSGSVLYVQVQMAHSSSRRSWRGHLYRRLVAVQKRFVRRREPRPGVFFQYPPFQSPTEELINGVTHAAAGIASFIAGIWLVWESVRQGDVLMIVGCAAYAASLTAVFTMSAFSHLLELPRLRQLFRTLDQASIYLYIAGSCTPYFIRFLLPNGWEWMLPVVWGIALLGAWDKLRGDRVNSVSLGLYVMLGWFPAVALKPLLIDMPAGCRILVFASGACYMLGVVFLLQDDRRRYFHAVWHLLVMAASVCTYAGIALYVV